MGGADDVGLALDRGTHGRVLAERRFADQAAFECAGAQQSFRLDRLVESELPARMEHGHHRGRPGASRRAVELPGTEYVHIFVEGAGQASLVPERDEVEVADVTL